MFFADPSMERTAKRFVRDRMRYLDDVYCAAGRVIGQLHDIVQSLKTSSNRNAEDIGFIPSPCMYRFPVKVLLCLCN